MPHLLTSALPYANGPLHLGHLAGAYLPADIYARYLRLMGKDVLWVCGSDEHGAAITLRAKKEGISPRDIIDKYHTLNKESFAALGISFDYYHRTSAPLHHETSQEFFRTLDKKGDEFIVRSTEQYYDPEFGQFLADRYIKGTCPRCGFAEAYGDQCEHCGSDLSPTELINPVSTLSGTQPILRETKHWYFDLAKHEEFLRTWIQEGTVDGEQQHDPAQWKKHVIGQCMSWLNEGLQPRAITRDLDWGISVPHPEAEGKVLYVWFDAPIGYISSTRQWCLENGRDWKDYWQNPDTELIHFIGKDNIVFHCLIFPAMLRAHGGYVLPKNVPANQFLNFEGDKFSKSRGWGIELHEYVEEFKDFPNGEDALRWALIRNLPEQQDADFTWDGFTEYYDKDLADKLGNFLNRVTVLTHKFFNGKVPTPAGGARVQERLSEALERIGSHIEAFRFKDAATAFVELATFGNTFLQEAAPWTLAKADPDDPRIAEVMYDCLQIAAVLALTAHPFVPLVSAKVRTVLRQEIVENGDWAQARDQLSAGKPLLRPGHAIGEAGVLFPKIVDRKDDRLLQIIQRQRDKLTAALQERDAAAAPVAETPASALPPAKPEISFEDFTKLDLRTATVLTAEPIKKSNKLLHLTIDLGGGETRSVVSGIAKHFDPADLPGQPVVVVTNLAPRKMAGVRSEAMILMAEDGEGTLQFVSPPTGFGNGWTVR
ncbi:methionyl-tRNA synthetase [Lewinella marina]|uniref:Methionine--tRNA ligase n=1 Tax=Neolewinella marina TaxID=438751 RepID=A0A2G0CGG4_9BACT|nr:methionine--tRNA ligase [Neolewinella marina]NJB86536.1 methionyl-tRNA synthetase [Neolewinella marina]PHK99010.1 methionine--tRNA ligase [Neolewinella marina]